MTRILVVRAAGPEAGYPRATAIVAALRAAGAELLVQDVALPGAGQEKQRIARAPWRWPAFALALLLARRKAKAAIAAACQSFAPHVVFVLYPGHTLVRWVRAVHPGALVLDLFLTAHDTLVLDRRVFARGSLFARFLRFLDRRACAAADLVLLDTPSHARRVEELTGLPRERFAHVPVSDEAAPRRPTAFRRLLPGEKLDLLFFGTGVPLHGLPILLEAVASTPGVRLTLVGGSAAERERAATLPPGRVRILEPFVARERLAALLDAAHLVAGVFGTSLKADLVVPLKVMHALSHGRAVLTGDSRAVRELLAPGHDVLVVPRGDPKALAALLAKVVQDPDRLAAVAHAGRARFDAVFSITATAASLAALLREKFDLALPQRLVAAPERPEPVTVA